MFTRGFASPEEVFCSRDEHLSAVRQMFSSCSIFVFTLGLTEGWTSAGSGAVFPIPPGIVTDQDVETEVLFRNYSYQDILDDLIRFVDGLRGINGDIKVILTVSPVPLTATFTDEHILVATAYSKSVLRAVCGQAEQNRPFVHYFPSFEIIAGHYNQGRYFESNKRTIAMSGVEHVMRVFRMTYLHEARPPKSGIPTEPPRKGLSMLESAFPQDQPVTCDEERFGTNIGF
jgi:hypothetical protein